MATRILRLGGWKGEGSIVAAVCGTCMEYLSIKYRLLRTKRGSGNPTQVMARKPQCSMLLVFATFFGTLSDSPDN
ncbi:hypothetical protein An09g06620 [Aspergillus niger]|uniref:Uncharacterized protein n=2 Tax=Aspergillus niger TaxID=5061 RepID=A2QUS5_ASPNC|nr:hypothetical protein An09g06620 [Aspergillus niger]CAK40455.1 hypothetical protein An09g06620 [Aspergillus niger]